MCFEGGNLIWTAILMLLPGALCKAYDVKYQQQRICALKGSTVVIPCLFYYPIYLNVTRVMWGHERSDFFDGPFIFDSMSTQNSKFQYNGDRNSNCSLRINQVEHEDAGQYAFRFITTIKVGKHTGLPGPILEVLDLKALLTGRNRTLKEGDSVNLTCLNGCDGNRVSSAFTWFKNGQRTHVGPELYLGYLSLTDSGMYTCSLSEDPGASSDVINIHVQYSPKDTSVSVSPALEVDAGTNITLYCISHANPPVDTYVWFKIDDHVLDVGRQPVLVSAEVGQYFCTASNKLGSQNSTVVTVRIKDYLLTSTIGYVTIPVVALLIVITACVLVRFNRKKIRAPENDYEEAVWNETHVDGHGLDSSQSGGGNQHVRVQTEVIYSTIAFNKRQTTTQQTKSGHEEENVIYSAVFK